jgi:hypothetical protein
MWRYQVTQKVVAGHWVFPAALCHTTETFKDKNKWKYFSTQCSPPPQFPKEHFFWKVPRLHPFVLMERATCRRRWVWSIGEMILTGENRSTGRETCRHDISCTTNLPLTDLGLNPDLCSRGRRLTAWATARPWNRKLTWIVCEDPVRTAQ